MNNEQTNAKAIEIITDLISNNVEFNCSSYFYSSGNIHFEINTKTNDAKGINFIKDNYRRDSTTQCYVDKDNAINTYMEVSLTADIVEFDNDLTQGEIDNSFQEI